MKVTAVSQALVLPKSVAILAGFAPLRLLLISLQSTGNCSRTQSLPFNNHFLHPTPWQGAP